MFDPNEPPQNGPDKNRDDKYQSDKHGTPPGAKPPALGKSIGSGTYLIKAVDSDGNETPVSAGPVDVREEGMIGFERLSLPDLQMLGIKGMDGVERALRGDSGETSSTSVGFNAKYAKGWDQLYGSGN